MKGNITNLARQLRRNQTPEEKQLWGLLRNRKLKGVKFFRQFPLVYYRSERTFFFIADFYSAEKSMVIELDGKIHEQQKEQDESRDEIIKAKGLKVLRIKNEELKEIEKVLQKIKDQF